MSLPVLANHIFFVAAIAAFSAILTWVLIRHLRILDVPNDRSSHTSPTPRGGGIAIVSGFLAGVTLIYLYGDSAPIRTDTFKGFLSSLILIAIVSFYDDFKTLRFAEKLGAQIFAIGICMITGSVVDAGQLTRPEAVWLYPLTLLWILGLTNAYNFMDGLDGMAAGTAVIVSTFFSFIAHQQGNLFISQAALSICASSFGFMIFNWPPAKIFMGDVGSTFLGFSFAVLTLIAARNDPASIPLLVMPCLLLHFIFDTVFTFGRRLLSGENIFQAHRSHLYQLLNRLGLSHKQVGLIYACLAVAQGLGAIWLANASAESRIWIFLPFLLAYSTAAFRIIALSKQRGLIS